MSLYQHAATLRGLQRIHWQAACMQLSNAAAITCKLVRMHGLRAANGFTDADQLSLLHITAGRTSQLGPCRHVQMYQLRC